MRSVHPQQLYRTKLSISSEDFGPNLDQTEKLNKSIFGSSGKLLPSHELSSNTIPGLVEDIVTGRDNRHHRCKQYLHDYSQNEPLELHVATTTIYFTVTCTPHLFPPPAHTSSSPGIPSSIGANNSKSRSPSRDDSNTSRGSPGRFCLRSNAERPTRLNCEKTRTAK